MSKVRQLEWKRSNDTVNGLLWNITRGDSALVAVALHDGHEVRKEVADLLALDDFERLHEEDPYTGAWTGLTDNRIVMKRSRFEVDLNRQRREAVYIEPEDAWNLTVWKRKPSPAMVARSLNQYDLFYTEMSTLFSNIEGRHGRFVVLDLHTYNHRRSGPCGPPDEPAENPEINVGTRTMNRDRWANVVDRFIEDVRSFDFLGRQLDVRENVRFGGGEFSRWIHRSFPNSACALAVEVKKFFMDEWSGNADPATLEKVKEALASTATGVIEELDRVPPGC